MTEYVVKLYVTCTVNIPMDAPTMEEAIEEVIDSENIYNLVENGEAEFVEEIVGALVDVVGDEEYEGTMYFEYDGNANGWVSKKMTDATLVGLT